MKLADYTPKARRERIMLAVDGILRDIGQPISTAELVKRVTSFLDAAEGSSYVAKELQKACPDGHPMRRATGETFKKYGKEMPRYEWLPSHKRAPSRNTVRPTPVPPDVQAAIDERRARIADLERSPDGNASEADDEWTVYPTDDNGFLED